MTKQQLIEYLDAVCDAECAVQACDNSIAQYQAYQRELYLPTQPQEPTHIVPSTHATKWDYCDYLSGIGILAFISALLLSFILGTSILTYEVLISSAIIASIALPLIIRFADNADTNKAKIEADEQNQELDNAYNAALTIYQQNSKIHHSAMSILDSAISAQEKLRIEATNQLSQLYRKNYLHPTFQNLIAAYQIREYLQMGICDTLEGPTGAYAQYMNDVRTARICDSITDLKRSLTSAIHGLQGTLARELQQIDSSLDSIRSEMSTSMNSLASQMQQMQNASSAHLDAHFNEANRQLRTLNENIAIAEHNRYIERCLQNVDTYLMKLPKSS